MRNGLGAHLPFQKLRSDRLINAIKEVQDPALCERVKKMGNKIRSENGLEKAAQTLEEYFNL